MSTHAVVHALNQWMAEHWTFNYENRIFPTPVIHLGIVDKAIEELEWVLERGAKIVLIRPAPVYGFMGPRSPALPEFDPFWKLVAEADLPVGMHASDSRLPAVHERVGGDHRRDDAVQGRIGLPGRRVPHEPAHHRHGGLAHRPRVVLPLPHPPLRPGGERQRLGPPPAPGPGARLHGRPQRLRRGSGRGRSSATSTSIRSTRRTPSAWWSYSAPTGSCSGRTTPTPRASPTR